MREGLNPAKDKKIETGDSFHQIIIPVYIPNEEGYFQGSFQILKLCLESLWKTSHEKIFISLINNGSNNRVRLYLEDLLKSKKINELTHTINVGKLNAILKGVVGHNMPIVTIADADVMFLPGWQNATYEIFNNFPRAGVVGLTPQFRLFKSKSANTIFDNFFSKRLRFVPVKNPNALKKFYKSIGWDDNYNKDYLRYNLILRRNKVDALVGSGHYVASYRRELFQNIDSYKNARLGLDSESYLDGISLKYGLWRLTTSQNYAYHLGNTEEGWMKEELGKMSPCREASQVKLRDGIEKVSKGSYFFKNKLFAKILSLQLFQNLFYKYKGLSKEVRKTY